MPNRFGFGRAADGYGYEIPGWLGWPLWIITLPLQLLFVAIIAMKKDFE